MVPLFVELYFFIAVGFSMEKNMQKAVSRIVLRTKHLSITFCKFIDGKLGKYHNIIGTNNLANFSVDSMETKYCLRNE